MTTRRPLALLLLSLTLSVPVTAPACLWDTDTLATEKTRFPEVSDIMSGNFPRHSKAFYEWRVGFCKAALEMDKTQPALYDDLAVAQHKLGNHKEAIATMQAKEAVKPGLYETYSNLGTFYIYTGELKEAVTWIDKALAINADAHFGRERYQKWLVEWVLEGKPGLPPPHVDAPGSELFGFAAYVLKQPHSSTDLKVRLNEARKGVLGMMRFADFDNPLLQEALGDILASGGMKFSAGNLANEAYQMALTKVTAAEDVTRLQTKYRNVAAQNEEFKAKAVNADLKAAVERGVALAAKVAKDEAAWIKAGKDASAAFTAKYLPAEKKKETKGK